MAENILRPDSPGRPGVTETIYAFCLAYADATFGEGVMTRKRLEYLFHRSIVSHVLSFTSPKAELLGLALLFIDSGTIYYYSAEGFAFVAFYDMRYRSNNLGMYMMTWCIPYFPVMERIQMFKQKACAYVYLGTCYSEKALYKTQFAGFEFHNGFRWSDDVKELKYLVRTQATPTEGHLLERQAYVDEFYSGEDSILAHALPVNLQ